MDRIVVGKKGEADEYLPDKGIKHVRFPLGLAIRFDDVVEDCPDFILDIDRREIIIFRRSCLQAGTSLQLNFYIPPKDKLLGTYKGKVLRCVLGEPGSLHVKIRDRGNRGLQRLDDFLNEKIHLVDKKA